MNSTNPIRILHVVGGMNRGGVETWLMHLLRHIDHKRFRMDFLVHTARPCVYDDEIRSLGSRIIPCLYPSKPYPYLFNLKHILKEHGPYHVVHSHVHHFSGMVLLVARTSGVPVRIAHSHNDTSGADERGGFMRHVYLRATERMVSEFATVGLAVSRKAARALYGPNWQEDSRWRVHYCSIDLEPFRRPEDRARVRFELGLPEDSFVLGHVGRFDEQKNHAFLVEIAAEAARREPRMRLLLVGDGPLRPHIEKKVHELGLTRNVIFAGLRPDIPRLMLGAMDVFVMPSFHEGLPLVGIEAQAAGLPLLLSDEITDELSVTRGMVSRMSLGVSASAWAERALQMGSERVDGVEALRAVEQSHFCINRSVPLIERYYRG